MHLGDLRHAFWFSKNMAPTVNVKALGPFNKEKALVGASSEYCESYCEIVWHLWWILGTDRYGSFSKWLFSLRPQRSDLHLYLLHSLNCHIRSRREYIQGVSQLSSHFVLLVFSASRAHTEVHFTIFQQPRRRGFQNSPYFPPYVKNWSSYRAKREATLI